jgi:phosphoglycolate phosphatase
MCELVIFDFDGTLVDTIRDVAICFNEALKVNGFPELDYEYIESLIGGDLETIVTRLLPEEERTPEAVDRVKKSYRKIYMECPKENSLPYDGIRDLLYGLKEKGIKLAVNSNKSQQLLETMTYEIFGKEMFESVVGYDESRPSKPDPYGVNEILRVCGAGKEKTVYVGDGKSDMLTAENAGLKFVYVTWGQGRLEKYCEDGSISLVDDAEELRQVLIGE